MTRYFYDLNDDINYCGCCGFSNIELGHSRYCLGNKNSNIVREKSYEELIAIHERQIATLKKRGRYNPEIQNRVLDVIKTAKGIPL